MLLIFGALVCWGAATHVRGDKRLLLRTNRSSPRGLGQSAPLRENQRCAKALLARDTGTVRVEASGRVSEVL